MRTCSPEPARSSKFSIISSKSIVSPTSLRQNAGSTCKVTVIKRPVLPRLHREAIKRSEFSVREHRSTVPSAKSRVRANTCFEITP